MARRNSVVSIEDHPTKVLARVQKLAADLDKVRFSQNINDLARARKVSMAGIWACLELGSIDERWIIRNDLGLYGKLHYFVTGQEITVDFLIDQDGVLNILFATTDEED